MNFDNEANVKMVILILIVMAFGLYIGLMWLESKINGNEDESNVSDTSEQTADKPATNEPAGSVSTE